MMARRSVLIVLVATLIMVTAGPSHFRAKPLVPIPRLVGDLLIQALDEPLAPPLAVTDGRHFDCAGR